MYIPPKHHIPALEDPIAYYYIPVFRSFFLKRLQICLDLLPERAISRLLDVGCGTGVILPELVRRADAVWAVDSQLQDRSLKKMMELEKISAQVAAADLLRLPFKDSSFDAVLLISILEHIADQARARDEIFRVLKPGGVVVAGFPTKNALTDRLLGASTAFHVATHRQILQCFSQTFNDVQVVHFPKYIRLDWSLYAAFRGWKP